MVVEGAVVCDAPCACTMARMQKSPGHAATSIARWWPAGEPSPPVGTRWWAAGAAPSWRVAVKKSVDASTNMSDEDNYCMNINKVDASTNTSDEDNYHTNMYKEMSDDKSTTKADDNNIAKGEDTYTDTINSYGAAPVPEYEALNDNTMPEMKEADTNAKENNMGCKESPPVTKSVGVHFMITHYQYEIVDETSPDDWCVSDVTLREREAVWQFFMDKRVGAAVTDDDVDNIIAECLKTCGWRACGQQKLARWKPYNISYIH